MKLVAWFSEVDKDDVGLVGGKGANLGELTKAGIPVPSGFAVTSHVYFHFVEQSGLTQPIRDILSRVDVNDSARLQSAAREIKGLISSASMPADVASQITRAYREMGGGPVAVRSSATAEDLAEASFAGQQSTYLNVEGEEAVVKAVQECWASLFEARAIFYRQQAGFEHLKVGIAVVVQHMVQSERSGVMFTLEPVTGDRDKIVIEAIYGLGEAVVSGAVTPDYYVIDKKSLAVRSKKVERQERQLVRNLDAAPGQENNVWLDIPAESGQAQKLTDEQIAELAEIGSRVEEHYGRPQDIEWAAEGGKFYLVQARPVTVTGAADDGAAESGLEGERAPILVEGSPASPGVAFGPVKIVLSPEGIDQVEAGDILVAEMTTPDFVPAMKRAAAIVTDKGGRTCHAAIVSRELGVPCIVGTEKGTSVLQPGQMVTVDGARGRIYEGRAEVRLAWALEQKNRRAVASHIKTKTRVYVNLAEPGLADEMAGRNVDGVGLLRAEFIVADHIKEHPRLFIDEGRPEEFTHKLASGLRSFAKAFHPRPVVYRTTDFKTNEYRNLKGGDRYEQEEENPMIGYRGASRYITDEDVFRLEVEAIKTVRAEYPNLWVMIPFVRTPQELAGVKALMERFGLARSEDFKLWMMAEVPSNVLILDKFIDVGIDGISIGSNDLTQLILGIDRDNSRFAQEFDERNEAVMVALERLITGAKARGVTVSICGQAPSDYPELTQKLVRWGITSVSVNPDVIDRTREIIAQAESVLEAELAASGAVTPPQTTLTPAS
ncbi:MAG: phosphoenolpyruvate synthase [Dehalococcoidia bacterium]|nr:phosphoenolpyruvate synthase [Dehalococcoidia bacterium]